MKGGWERLEFLRQEAFAVFVQSLDRLSSFVATPQKEESMGAQISKNAGKEEAAVEKPAEGAAVAAKANGQVRREIWLL